MKKYAIVPINIKQIKKDLYIRCALIEFKTKENNFYQGTRFIDCSPYFKNDKNALQYCFYDDGYVLLEDHYDSDDYLVGVKRKYHTCCSNSLIDDRLLGVTFEFDNDLEALDFFKFSIYYNCDETPLEVI